MLDLSLIRDGERVLAAVSGGADSVAMLRLLHKEAEKGRIVLYAAHFEHGIRGADSDRDAAFVESLCARFGIPFSMERADVPALARTWGMGLEQAAREARYGFLRREKERLRADSIALAHHMDDQAETVLMHLLRGASLQGARGMEVRRGDLYRPLLHVTKAQILAYLHEIGQEYCQDETNLETDTTRNLLRNQAMPILESAYPGAVRSLSRFAAMAGRDEDFLSEAARNVLKLQTPYGWMFRVEGVHEALSSRAIAAEMDVEGESLTRALRLGNGEKTQGQGIVFERCGSFLHGIREKPVYKEEMLRLEGETVLPGVCALRARETWGAPITEDMWRQRMDRGALEGCVLRTRRAGDWMIPFGMKGRKLLSDIYTDRKMPRPLRDVWPVAARGSEILWIPGVGISEKARMGDGPCVEIQCKAEKWLQQWEEIRKDEDRA